MAVEVRIRWGHLDRMPKCRHGRIEGFCRACEDKEEANAEPRVGVEP